MALSDPQSVTVNSVAKTLPRVNTDGSGSTYRAVDGSGVTFQLKASHQYGNRVRHVVALRQELAVTDPLIPANNVVVSYSATFALDVPKLGVAPADAKILGDALVAWLAASSGANLLKLAGGES